MNSRDPVIIGYRISNQTQYQPVGPRIELQPPQARAWSSKGAEVLEGLIGVVAIQLLCGRSLALKLKDVKTKIIEEDNGTYAVVCSALGVYSVGKTLKEAKRGFQQALDLHLSVLREKATKDLAIVAR